MLGMTWGSRNPWLKSVNQVYTPGQQRRTSNASTISSHSTASLMWVDAAGSRRPSVHLPELDLRAVSTYAKQLSTNHAVYKPMVQVFREVLKDPSLQYIVANPDQIDVLSKAVADKVRTRLGNAPGVPSMDNNFFCRAAADALQKHTAKLTRASIREERAQAELRKVQRGH